MLYFFVHPSIGGALRDLYEVFIQTASVLDHQIISKHLYNLFLLGLVG